MIFVILFSGVVDAGIMRNKEEKTNTNQALSHLNVENNGILSNSPHANANNNSTDRINVELSESDLQLQVKINETSKNRKQLTKRRNEIVTIFTDYRRGR